MNENSVLLAQKGKKKTKKKLGDKIVKKIPYNYQYFNFYLFQIEQFAFDVMVHSDKKNITEGKGMYL